MLVDQPAGRAPDETSPGTLSRADAEAVTLRLTGELRRLENSVEQLEATARALSAGQRRSKFKVVR